MKKQNKIIRWLGPADFSWGRKFVILEFQSIAHIYAERQQGNGNLGNNAGIVVFDEGIVTADINDGAQHIFSL